MEKATKEAKLHTSWINPNAGYDEALRGFVTRLLAPGGPFLDAFRPFQRLVARSARSTRWRRPCSRSPSPGVPDFYQGTELWDLTLVDPDNRRPVDFARRQALLDEPARPHRRRGAGARTSSGLCAELLEHWRRRAREALRDPPRAHAAAATAPGSSAPAPTAARGGGPRAEHVVAFARRDGPDAAIVAVPRLDRAAHRPRRPLAARRGHLGQTWVALGDEGLAGAYRDRFTGLTVASERHEGVAVLPVPALFAHFPVALLEREGDEP